MEINKNSKTFLYVGLIVSIVAGICAYVILNKAENLVPVIVARKTIEPRTLIKEDMIQVEKVSALNRKANALDDTELVVGGFSTVKIFEGQDILQPMVAKQFDEKGSSELSLAIPLQYRKRYELLQHVKLSFNHATSNDSYNTASGMSCCNRYAFVLKHSRTPKLQYRKRYELLQRERKCYVNEVTYKLQYRKRYELLQLADVRI